jgi:GNAT superfamily N-acetyltransferase
MIDPSGAVVVRDARPEDLPRIVALLQQLAEQGEHPEMEGPLVTDRHEAALRDLAADPRARLLVLEAEGRVMGSLAVYVLPNLSHGGRPFAIVENVIVDGAARGSGYGRLLMDRAVDLARDAGCYKVSLTSNNRRAAAHRFYERIGFTGTHRGFTRYFAE